VLGTWHTIEILIAPQQATAATAFRFHYNTVDGCCGPSGTPGWYIDDVQVLIAEGACPPSP
jgi:hypothetical protein